MGCFKRTASKHVYYLGWNRSPAQVGCMRQALGPGALGRPRGIRWKGRWEGGSGWGTHVNPWLFHFNVWQNSLQIKKVNNYYQKESFPGSGKEPTCQCRRHRRPRFDPGVEKIPQRRAGQPNPLQYSCLENPMDRRAWRVPLGPKELGTSEATVFTNMQACMRHFKTTTLENPELTSSHRHNKSTTTCGIIPSEN